MQNLYTRTLTGVIFAALITGSMLLHPLAFTAVIFFIMLLGMNEFYHLAKSNGFSPAIIPGFILGALAYLLLSFVATGWINTRLLVVLPLIIFLFLSSELFRPEASSTENVFYGIFPVFYISIPLAMLVFLTSPIVTGGHPFWHLVFGFFLISWAHDTFAYFTGLLIGKHKLFEKISPKKTWEGSVGGTIFGLVAAFVMSLFARELNIVQWMGAALVIVITGTLGDLSESMMKRKFHVKDSGNFFPGHGGVLDRFDSILFSAPAFFCYLILLNL